MSEEAKVGGEEKTASEIASLGGKAAAKKMSRAARSARASQAAAARWGGGLPVATYGSPDRPLRIGSIEIPCYVLSDERRVIVQRGVLTALSMSPGTGREGEGDRLLKFVTGKALTPYISGDLLEMIKNPIRFQTPSGGSLAYGYEATILADLCDAVLEARKMGSLHPQQVHIAAQCEILVRALTKTGIVALVDEATGYQDVRSRDALAKILEAFVAKELQQWVRTFPLEYFKEMCRLRGVNFSPNLQLPRYFGHLTNDLVYARLAPGVLEELKRKNPTEGEKRQRKSKHFQWLTADHGHPRLRIHLEGVIVAMKLSKDWKEFYCRVNDLYPKMNETPTIPGMRYDDPDGDDDQVATSSSSTALPPPSEQSPPASQE